MPVIPFIPLIVGAVAGGATVAAAHMAASGQKDAAETNATASEQATAAQSKTAQDTLDFEKQTQAQRVAALSPYGAVGLNALTKLNGGALPPPSSMPAPPVAPVQTTTPTPAPTAVAMPTPTTTAGNTPGRDYQPMTLQQLGASQTQSSVGPASVGETRTINGQQAKWDGQGWAAMGAA